jgi:hypothetical protein
MHLRLRAYWPPGVTVLFEKPAPEDNARAGGTGGRQRATR